uniref:Uncharacterized protein n=2 Tax=Oryza TaxID=4527 RepID=Q2R4H0_ORYSJ|nr:hypothetical protein LOC_Os11g28510 [Oryza sativa Japonica Group]
MARGVGDATATTVRRGRQHGAARRDDVQWQRSGTLGDGDARMGREVVRRQAQGARQRARQAQARGSKRRRWAATTMARQWHGQRRAATGRRWRRRGDDDDGDDVRHSSERRRAAQLRATATAIGRCAVARGARARQGERRCDGDACTACGRERAREPHQAPMP